MKNITITKPQILGLTNAIVDTKDPAYREEPAVKNIRQLVWKTMLQPMEANQNCSVDFLYSFVKIKDCLNELADNPDMESVQLEDADFDLLYSTFQAFNNWKSEFARVILLASDALKAAKEGTNVSREKRKTNR